MYPNKLFFGQLLLQFKHGKLNDPRSPLLIKLDASDQQMNFSIRNKKANGGKENAKGIGLQNVRNRLALAYPGKHELVTEDGDDMFNVNLRINLGS